MSVTQFDTTPVQPTFTKGVTEFDSGLQKPQTVDPIERERAVGAHSALLKAPIEVVRGQVEADSSVLERSAEASIGVNERELVTQAIGDQLSDQIALLEEEISQTEGLKRLLPPHLTALLTSEDPTQVQYAAARLGKFFQAKQLINERVKQSEDYWLGDLGDVALSSVQDIFRMGQRRENSRKVEDLILSDLSPVEFEAQLVGILDEMADQGWFTQDNQFYLQDFVDFFTYGEHTETAKVLDRWSVINTLLFLPEVGLAAKAGKGLYNAASAAALVAPSVARSAANGVVATGVNVSNDVARMVGLKTGDSALVKQIIDETVLIDDVAQSATILGNHTSPSVATPSTLSMGETWAHTSNQAVLRFELESEAVKDAFDIVANAGEAIDADRMVVLREAIIDKRMEAMNTSEVARSLDTVVSVDATENIVAIDVFGTRQGKPFIDSGAAQRFADSVGGEVRQWHSPGEFVVVKSHNVPTDIAGMKMEDILLWKATEVDQLGEGSVRTWFGSALAKTTESNNAVLKQGEAAFDRWTHTTKLRLNKVDKLVSKTESNEVFTIFDKLRDGVISTDRTFGLSTTDFKKQFYQQWGREATEGQVAVFKAYQEALDIDLLFKSDLFFKRAVNDGVVIYPSEGANFRVVPTKASEAGDNFIWDVDGNQYVKASDLDEDAVIFRNYDPYNQDIHGSNAMFFVERNATTRRLYHTDVMARNTGGPRIYDKDSAKYFVKQNRSTTLVDGSEVKGNPGTMMAVRSQDEAVKAVEQINTILTKIDELVDGKVDYDAVRALSGDTSLRQVIRANNEFMPDLQDVDGLVDLFESRGLQLGEKFDYLGDGEKLIDTDVLGGFGDMRMSQSIDIQAISPNARGTAPLVGYGGKANSTLGAQQAIRRSLVQSQGAQTERAYLARSINGFLKAAMENGVLQNPDKLLGLTLKQRLLQAEIATSKTAGKRLALEQKTIAHRINQRGWGDVTWERWASDFSEFLYNKRIPGADFVADISSQNPINAMRGFTFDAKLGMFAVDQLFVQGSQVINIMGVAGVQGIKGTGLSPITRWLTINQAPEVLDDAAKRFSKLAGISEDQFKEMITMYRASGRNVIDASLTELANPHQAASRVGSTFEKVRRAGRTPFNEGERIARASAHNTAYIEYVTKFPGREAMSQHGKRWIAHRQDVLTQGMTSASRSPLEKLPMFQFMSYQFRINETIFAGSFGGKSILSRQERVRLALTHLVVYGMSGWAGLSFLGAKIADSQGVDADNKALALARYGMLDAALTTLTGEQTALSARIGGGDGVWMLLKGYTENNVFETVGGPSFGVAWEVADAGLQALSAVASTAYKLHDGVEPKDFEDVGEAVVKAGRIFSTGSKAYNAYMAERYGQYLTKSGSLIANDLTSTEAALIAFGIPLEEYTELWTNLNFRKLEKQFLKGTIKQMQKMYDEANVLLDRGDYAGYTEIVNQIILHKQTMLPSTQEIIEYEVFDRKGSLKDSIILRDTQRIQLLDLEKGLK